MSTAITVLLWLANGLLVISLLLVVVFLVLWLKGHGERSREWGSFREERKKSREGIEQRIRQGSRLTGHRAGFTGSDSSEQK